MDLDEFINSSGEFFLSPESASKINAALATLSVSDIPSKQRPMVTEYLVNAFNMNSVKLEVLSQLEELLRALQGFEDDTKVY